VWRENADLSTTDSALIHYDRNCLLRARKRSGQPNQPVHGNGCGNGQLQLCRELVGGLRRNFKLRFVYRASHRPGFRLGHRQGYLNAGRDEIRICDTVTITGSVAPPTITGVSLACTLTTITDLQTTSCTPTVTGTGAFTNTVNFTVSPVGGGTFSTSSGVASGTAVTFTPESTGAENATLTATSTEDATKNGQAVITVTMPSAGPTCGGMSLGAMGSLNGFVPFPSTYAWNTNIASAAVDPNSATIIADTQISGHYLHPDFSNIVDGNYGIPYIVVDSSTQPLVPIGVVAYANESDVADAPFPANAPIEGYPGNCVGGPGDYINDQHVLVLDRNRCMLYETFNSKYCNGTWSADSETIWDMQSSEMRPWGWTSADAAGLSVFAGLIRYDEVAAGAINHAIRFTLPDSLGGANGGYFVPPASHAAANSTTVHAVMGMRIRLKASYVISGFSATNQVILKAMQQYGMILADNGSSIFFQGAPDSRWDDNDLNNLKLVPGSAFEVVKMTNPSYPGWDANSAPTGSLPTINSFTATPSNVTAGTPVTLSWTTTSDSYDYIDLLGGVHGGSITITPAASTTYHLTATNQYGATTEAVTVTVH
jgi:hypothetical protein